MNILVTGSTGQVGQELQYWANQYPQFNFTFADRSLIDLNIPNSIEQIFTTKQFDYCINCAAYTAVDLAEEEVEKAKQINAKALDTLAKEAKRQNCRIIHLSTDYIYHSKQQNTPFIESNLPNPQNVYAQSKREGEKILMDSAASAMVIRTSWVYSTFGNNFVKTMLKLAQSRTELKVIFDQIGSPTYARDLAKAILDILSSKPSNIDFEQYYNYSNEGICSWYDFAQSIFEYTQTDCDVHPILSKDFPQKAKRPHFSVLDKSKIKKQFNLLIPHWRTSLKSCLEIL